MTYTLHRITVLSILQLLLRESGYVIGFRMMRCFPIRADVVVKDFPPSLLFSCICEFDDDDDLLLAASQKLSWEKVQETQQRPVLNLSARDRPLEEAAAVEAGTTEENEDSSQWKNGQRWTITKQHLQSLGIDIFDETDLLSRCPQLFRLDPSTVQETASWIIESFDVSYLESEWTLLSYPRDDVVYGLEFVGAMMMMTPDLATNICRQSSALLLQGIEGGIQERAVQEALSAAAEATSKARQSIAADTMRSFRQMRANIRNENI